MQYLDGNNIYPVQRKSGTVLGPVSGKILSLETDLSSLITMVTIVFSMLKITRGLKIFEKLAPGLISSHAETNCLAKSDVK